MQKFVLSQVNRSPALIYVSLLFVWWRINWLYSTPSMSGGWAIANTVAVLAFSMSILGYAIYGNPAPTVATEVALPEAEVTVNTETD
ncbi:MAG: hypothetical protein V5A44_13355 [Haloarculaceae archaeon]